MVLWVKVNVVEIIDVINVSNSKFLYLDFIFKYRVRKVNEYVK